MKKTNPSTISHSELMVILQKNRFHYKNENTYIQIRPTFKQGKPDSIDFVYVVYDRTAPSITSHSEELILELGKFETSFELYEANQGIYFFKDIKKILSSYTKSINPIMKKNGFVEIKSLEEAEEVEESSKQITKENTLKEIHKEPSTNNKPKESEDKKVDFMNLLDKLVDVLNILKDQKRNLKTQPEPVKIQSKPVEIDLCPVTIFIQNTTNKTIENIKLFNYDHKDQNELRYSCAFMNYADVLRTIASYNPESGIELKKIRVMLNNIQTNKSKSKIELKAVTSTIFGSALSKPHELKVDKYQYQPNIFEGNLEHILNVNSQIFIDEILPFQEIIIHLFIEKK